MSLVVLPLSLRGSFCCPPCAGHYGDELARVIKDMVIISQVAHWAREIEKHGRHALRKRGFESVVTRDVLNAYRVADQDRDEHSANEMLDFVDLAEPGNDPGAGKVIDESRVNALTGALTQSQVMRINELLGRWEEPEIVGEEEVRFLRLSHASVSG